LSLLNTNGKVEATYVVEGCLRRKLTAVHFVRLQDGESLVPGSEVELGIDWDRRADHVSLFLFALLQNFCSTLGVLRGCWK
jgi:hypothetical protein